MSKVKCFLGFHQWRIHNEMVGYSFPTEGAWQVCSKCGKWGKRLGEVERNDWK